MPPHLIPHLSPSHRHTTLTLYRALLHQLRHLPPISPSPSQSHANPKDLLKNLIHSRFHSARHIVSPHFLQPRFLLAYEALDHLDAAVAGDSQILREIEDLLSRCSLTSTRPPLPRLSARTHAARKSARLASSLPLPKLPSWTNRPLPLERIKGGRRRVPVLFTANHIPVLRFSKPQPSSLSGYLTSRIRQRQNRQDLLAKLTSDITVARGEDEWDGRLRDFAGLDGGMWREGSPEASWTGALIEEVKVVKAKLARERKVNQEVGRAMQGVVDREGELAEMEAGERGKRLVGKAGRRRVGGRALPNTEEDGGVGRKTKDSMASSASTRKTTCRPLAGRMNPTD
ncbi:unnamed protein product [Zymoseptoria tritici ST99CH_3D7]|uniref:Uncharacterized protein n=1 Tax=Zymoseptoria tritici (strain ST99CH_3D7) TaxID=1276538 RepID=A0A1X7RHU9_ZYMT9|nr:unnamed protein product [Zymoseptoria tritici ST99CH_3D7]